MMIRLPIIATSGRAAIVAAALNHARHCTEGRSTSGGALTALRAPVTRKVSTDRVGLPVAAYPAHWRR
ncbi:hypothetical protein [Agrococcus sp. SCSIO52902]|uniref:hypothetical protein n=1 Tax=Agrococcus sp. SCSIO52902 TaxID=2933290 RepID=UPI001FF5E5C2|nr:hypothetical protein [Agrococcus sp. SCSIO52902]UOW00897.1 hypothetical protein MU522_00240 [Agrococcus sp. SCSIO52902]